MARRGVAHVPEGRGTFASLSVFDNLRLGAWTQRGQSARDIVRVYEFFPVLYDRRDQQAGTLSGGEQQMLALGRAMMARPRLLLLDEPSLGLAPLVTREIFARLGELNEKGTTILVVEQNAALALGAAKHAYVLETGRVVLGGTAEALRRDDSVRKSYLGY
jgi:branched-chain amino acid transport system ATP-binding protein